MQAATLTAVVVFPTPPFWLAMAYTMPMATPDASGGRGGSGRFPPFGAMLVRSQRSFFADRRRLVAMPGRRGYRAGVGANLAQHVQGAPPRAGVRHDTADRIRREPEVGRRRGRVGRFLVRHPALPGHQRPARVASGAAYSHRTGATRRPRADDVAASDAVAPLLGTCAHDLGVVEPHRVDRGPQEVALAVAASTSVTWAFGSVAASTRPGTRLRRRGRRSSPRGGAREPRGRRASRRCAHRSRARGSCTEVGASGRRVRSPSRTASGRAPPAGETSSGEHAQQRGGGGRHGRLPLTTTPVSRETRGLRRYVRPSGATTRWRSGSVPSE